MTDGSHGGTEKIDDDKYIGFDLSTQQLKGGPKSISACSIV
jgi:hypothetical protein